MRSALVGGREDPLRRMREEALRSALVRAFLEAFGENLVSLVLYGSYARGPPS